MKYSIEQLFNKYLELKAQNGGQVVMAIELIAKLQEEKEIHGDDSNVENDYLNSFPGYEQDPNEGDNGSIMDQYPDAFISEEEQATSEPF